MLCTAWFKKTFQSELESKNADINFRCGNANPAFFSLPVFLYLKKTNIYSTYL